MEKESKSSNSDSFSRTNKDNHASIATSGNNKKNRTMKKGATLWEMQKESKD
jgi:hypothetical protein